MQIYDFKIDFVKLDRSKIIEREYTRKDGVVVKVKEYKFRAVIQDQDKHKEIYQGDGFTIKKVGFIAEPSTKAERDEGKENVFFGDITRLDNAQNAQTGDVSGY